MVCDARGLRADSVLRVVAHGVVIVEEDIQNYD